MGGVNVVIMFGKDLEIKKLTQNIKVMLRMEFHGLGIMIFPNGRKYVGGWKVGRWNGQGTFTTSNGSKYEGEWKNGERHGQGTHTYPDGSKYEGEYKDDWELNGTQYDKNGNIKYKYVNGKQIKQ